MNLDALLNLVTQDVNEVGGLVNVVFGHETDVEEGSAVMGTHGFKLCRRVRAGVGSLVDPLDKVAALVIGKEPNGTGTEPEPIRNRNRSFPPPPRPPKKVLCDTASSVCELLCLVWRCLNMG